MRIETEVTSRFTSKISFPEDALGRQLDDGPVDNFLRGDFSNTDIVVSIPYPFATGANSDPKDVLQLTVNGVSVGETVALPPTGNAVHVTLRASDRPLTTSLVPRKVKINYVVSQRSSGDSDSDRGPDDQFFMTQVRTPGGLSLAPLIFGPEVTKHGISPDALIDDGDGSKYVQAVVKGYYGATAGDLIIGTIDGDDLATEPVEVEEGYCGADIYLHFPLSLLKRVNGSERRFSYRIIDRGLNLSIVPEPVELLVDLGASTVPSYAAEMFEAIDAALADEDGFLVITRHDLADFDELVDEETDEVEVKEKLTVTH